MRVLAPLLVLLFVAPVATAHFYVVSVEDLPVGPDITQQIQFTFEYEENATYYFHIESSRARQLGVDYAKVALEPWTPPGRPVFDWTNVTEDDLVLRLNNTGSPAGQIDGGVALHDLDTSQARPGVAGYNFTAVLVGYQGQHGISRASFRVAGGESGEVTTKRAPGMEWIALLAAVGVALGRRATV